MNLTPFAYLAFHGVVVGSILIGKLLYHPLKLPKLSSALPVSLLAMLPLILLDIGVTGYFWDFSPEFVLPLPRLLHLPIEEWFFFITVPYGLLVLEKNLDSNQKFQTVISQLEIKHNAYLSTLFLLAVTGIFVWISVSYHWSYTTVMLLGFSASLFFAILFLKHSLKILGVMLLLTLLLTTIFNMYLTALPIVTYAPDLKSGLMVGTIPIEDFLFGGIMIVNLAIAQKILIKNKTQ